MSTLHEPVAPPYLHIRFVVEEYGPDGERTERHVSFGDFVPHHQARDFFDRCGISVDQLFARTLGGRRVIVADNTGPNKIQVIKAIRELTSIGLKEAKDLCEGGFQGVPSGHLMACDNPQDADHAVSVLRLAGASVRVAPASLAISAALPVTRRA